MIRQTLERILVVAKQIRWQRPTTSKVPYVRYTEVFIEILDGAGTSVLGYVGEVVGEVQRFAFPGRMKHGVRKSPRAQRSLLRRPS